MTLVHAETGEVVSPLTDDETTLLDECQGVIERGLASFVEVGDALLTIRDQRLYRSGFATFEHYCSERWGFSRRRAYQLLEAAEVTEALADVNNCSQSPTPLPANEGQARALAPLKADPPRMAEAMAKATDRAEAEGRAPTARDITDAVADVKGEPRPEPKPEPKAHVANNSGNNEWFTPEQYVDLARKAMGGIDLDPASDIEANKVVKAKAFFTAADDGLTREWSGRVWMNPPYSGNLIGQFVDKMVAEFEAGHVKQAVVLVNNATETAWFQTVAAKSSAACFVKGRIRFWYPNRDSFSPLQGQVILYLGDRPASFRAAFGSVGWTP